MKQYSKLRKILFSLTILFTLIFISLLCGEIYIRFTKEFITPEILRNKSLQYSPSLFSRHVFPTKTQNVKNGKFIINQKGYRGDNFSIEKPQNTIRILVYGGSAVFGRYLSNGKDWPSHLEANLKKAGISNVEVINAGIPGHASFDSLGRLFAEGHTFNPDYVLIYNAWNDIKYFTSDTTILRLFKPYYKHNDPRIYYNGWIDKTFSELSQFYVYLRAGYYERKYKIDIEGAKFNDKTTKNINPLGPRQYKLNLQMFVDLSINIDAVPLLLTQARLVSIDNTDGDKKRINYGYQKMNHKELLKAFELTDKIIKDVSKSKNVDYLDISKEMTGRSEYFKDHIHLTNKGSKKLASLVSQYFIYKLIKQ